MRMDTSIWYWFGHGLLEIGSESLNVTFTIDECNVEYGFMGVNKGSKRTSPNSFHFSQLTFKHRKNSCTLIDFTQQILYVCGRNNIMH